MKKYKTNFSKTEDPISEGGIWLNGRADGIDWADVVTAHERAMGSGGAVEYSDPTALLAGAWGPDQEAQATVYSRNQTNKYYQEVEIRLRSAMSAHVCTGYEIFFRCLKTPEAYLVIARWEGPLAKFSYASQLKGAEYGVADGDTIKASIIGNEIKVYKNGVLLVSVKDDTFKTGNPGIGFNYGCEGTYGDFGLLSFMATDSPEAP
jgi:hypothetical protein